MIPADHPFFVLHADLPREGPGETADVAWAAEVAGTPDTARILDAACGPGGDLGALLRAAPKGHVTAIDLHAPFIDAARARWGADGRVTLTVGDMTTPEGPFDLIWCAGAVYFLGIEAALAAWRPRLAPGGAIAFSEPCLFTDAPSAEAIAFWQGYEGLTDAAGIAARVTAAGYETLATRALGDIAWESYFRPQEARIARLRPGADAGLAAVLDEAEAEIAGWRACRAETGYLLSVVRPA
ncbi:class I SAM-dependent methyltransferase [Roseicyclus persicicus]|uniref:Class I SAM-dependent methyltransferase n=1 Tax=Roseicyclus persicicus TaxID=2650661 RepID=A0A7X6H3L1_9RHOB|nr:class I SAM-dependent methyltransferase [Roseibacterium persicicum]NKX46162.1 class I SAM-dependent methyltransferase [Roseibacterium persicicum]